MSKSDDQFGKVIDGIVTALRLLGADSALQGAVGSWRDGQDDAATAAAIGEWVETERDRIAAAVQVFKRSDFWEPHRRYVRTDRGCSRRADPETSPPAPQGP